MSKAPVCSACGDKARLTSGREVYPHRRDLHEKPIWKCRCGAYVGCHPGTTDPLGTPANAELRKARMLLHEKVLDPLWKTAADTGGYHPEDAKARIRICRSARRRVYAYLAFKLGIERDDTHTGMFDLERCRDAWRALQGVTYPEIRDWWKAQEPAA
jgi:hypothetical protein